MDNWDEIRTAYQVARLGTVSGAAEVLVQRDVTGGVLAERLLALVNDPARRRRMSAAARSLARPDAARVIVDRALQLAGM